MEARMQVTHQHEPTARVDTATSSGMHADMNTCVHIHRGVSVVCREQGEGKCQLRSLARIVFVALRNESADTLASKHKGGSPKVLYS